MNNYENSSRWFEPTTFFIHIIYFILVSTMCILYLVVTILGKFCHRKSPKKQINMLHILNV